ncbi:TetR/AcrR family transcriptional regulator [Desulfoplanes formicivorans]|uniref:TetR family transcriptional regulator n=1 Tax=Desulfoplanes formicivorans TaxID=1592317 RepID=A0A194AJC2_9BACT|nr:TetR/AcrR family transcriptional regulator [Desulfoplanes formicivorans]GAU08849.1 TetR family transcriptional regulator [Desulfoplanes formicivorans]
MSALPKNLRAAILEAALDLFAENGFHSSPMSRIATLAGVGVGSIYRYFSDKDDLIHALFQRVDTPLKCAMEESLDPELPTHRQFVRFVTKLIEYLRSHPKEFRFIEQYYNSPYGIDKAHAEITQADGNPSDLFSQLFLKGQNEGTIRKMPLPVYPVMTFGPVGFLVRYSLSGRARVDDAMIQATAEACWNAIKA